MMSRSDIIDRALEAGVYLYLDNDALKFKAGKEGIPAALLEEIKQNKAAIIAHLQEMDQVQEEKLFKLPEITACDRNQELPLSFAQQRLWFIDQVNSGSAQYNMPGAFKLSGKLDLKAFEQAIHSIVERHEVLRTNFTIVEGKARQVILNEFDLHIPQVDLTHLNAEAQAEEITRIATEDTNKPFNFGEDLFLRAQLLMLSEQEYVVLFNLHHIASDGWSMGLVIKEFSTLYSAYCQGQSNPLPELKVQYVDYAQWQRDYLQGDVLDSQLGYWKAQLEGIPQVHSLPLDKPRPAQQSHKGAPLRQLLDKALADELQTFCKQQDVTLFMLLHSAFSLLVGRYSGENDVVVGSATAGRLHKDVEPLIGFFVNNLVLRSDLSQDLPYSEYLQNSKQMILDAYAHQHIPFDMLVEALSPERNLRYNPIIQIKLDVQNNEQVALQLHDLQLDVLDHDRDSSRHDLYLNAVEYSNGLAINWRYSTDIFVASTIERMAENLETLLRNIVRQPSASIKSIELVHEAERNTLLNTFNNTDTEYRQNVCLHTLFEEQAALHPDNIAVEYGDQHLTFKELNEQSNQLAHYLIEQGVTPNTIVGLSVERSLNMYVGLFAIMKAGGAYVPIDPGYPDERIEYMVEDSGIEIILTESHLFSMLPVDELSIVLLDARMRKAQFADYSKENVAAGQVSPTDLLYVIYTSGSTGQPKGVLVEHHSVVNFLFYSVETFLPEHLTGAFVSAPLAFDGTVCTLYTALLAGKTTTLLPAEDTAFDVLQEYIYDDSKPRLFKLTPGHLEALWTQCHNKVNSKARHVFVIAGELLTEKNLANWRDKLLPNCLFFNEYGPTEASVGTTVFETECGRDDGGVTGGVPIGGPLANAKLFVLNEAKQLQPVGAVGELYVGGAGLARGYHNQPTLSEEKFVAHPYSNSKQSGDRLYKTGDLVRWLENGVLEFSGRVDHQVKLRGFRIELGEIENQLSHIEGVHDCVVLCRDDEGVEKRLVAYVIPNEPLESEDEELLVEQKRSLMTNYIDTLKGCLPHYMVPGIFVFMEQFPLTPNGKIDRLHMPEPGEGDLQKQQYVAPTDDTQQILCEIWQEMLGVAEIGIEDNFFALGGDSIVSIQVVSRAREQGLHLTVKQLFEHQSIASLSPYVSKVDVIDAPQEPSEGEQVLLPVQHTFFDWQFANQNHFNQSVLLVPPTSFNEQALNDIVTALYQRHDALRLRFSTAGSVQQAHYLPFDDAMLAATLGVVDVSASSGEEQAQAITAECEQIQGSMNITNGPIFRTVLLKLSDTESRLLLACHHLVVDGVSWRVLLADMGLAWSQIEKGEPIQLRDKRSSFQQWGQALKEYATSDAMQAEREYWLEQLSIPVSPLPAVLNDSELVEPAKLQRIELDESDTQDLLGECNTAYRTQVNELLLAAVLLAYRNWTGMDNLRVDMEGHGREELFSTLDISETVGWFTSHYPLVLGANSDSNSNVNKEAGKEADLESLIKSVKEQHRAIPERGVGYSILKWLANDTELKEAEHSHQHQGLIFNYLGQFDASVNQDSAFTAANEFGGSTIAKENQKPGLISLNGMVRDGKLGFSLMCAPERFENQQAKEFAQHIESALKEVIGYCLLLNTLKLKNEMTPESALIQEDDNVEELFI